jgi:light-regulated signal transduction histidine kinase (bacteriophytochrome)
VDILPKVVHAFVLIAVIYLVSRYSSISSKEEQQLQKDFKQLETYSLQLKANQQQLQAQNEELKAINQELEKFAFVASHDLKTPVRNIKSFLGLAKRQIKDYDDKDVHEYLRFAQSSTEQMQALVEDILAFSRITPRKEEYQEVQLAHVVQMAQDNIQNFTQSKNAKIEIATLPTIYAHPEQMTRLFESLIENGILYNKSENPKVSISSKQLPNSSYQVLVSDNGIGVGKEHFEKIFKIFKRLHTQVEYQGSGVGLAKCKKIVELHGGIISLQSQVGKGTTFYIKLPSRTERTGD